MGYSPHSPSKLISGVILNVSRHEGRRGGVGGEQSEPVVQHQFPSRSSSWRPWSLDGQVAKYPFRNKWAKRTDLRILHAYLLLALTSHKERMGEGPWGLKYEVL